MNRFFHEVIEPNVESVPVIQVRHTERHNGRAYCFSQTVHRNVYTEFDQSLSDYLAAVHGDGFPAFSVHVEVCEERAEADVNRLQSSFHPSVPHALKDLVERAFRRVGPIELTYQRSAPKRRTSTSLSHRRKIQERDIGVLGEALSICETIGDAHFLEISGDFGTIIATPPNGLNSVLMHLTDGIVSVPSSATGDGSPFKWPIYAFNDHAASNVAAGSYLARVAQTLVTAKESAIQAFRSTAEQRIVDFHMALGGRPLDGHWRDSAQGLVARLEAGLGTGLKGISEHARGIGLDLSAAVAATRAGEAPRAPAGPVHAASIGLASV